MQSRRHQIFKENQFEEEDLPQSKMTKSKKKQKESAEEKSTAPSEVTKSEFPDQKLRKTTEKADLKPPEEIQVKSTEPLGDEQPEQIKIPDKKRRRSTKEKVSEPVEELKLEHFGEKSRRSIDEASLELSEKRKLSASKKAQKSSFDEKFPEMLEEITLGLLDEINPDVEEETQEKSIKEKGPGPSDDRKLTTQKYKRRRSSGQPKLKDTLMEPSKEKDPVLQTQTEPELPEEKLIKSAEKTDHKLLQITTSEISEKSQPELTNKKNLELPNIPKPREEREFPKEDSSEPSKPKYPLGKNELVLSEYPKKLSEIKPTKSYNEYQVASPRESVESFSTVYEAHNVLRDPQADMSELFPVIPALETPIELRDSIVLPQELENLGCKESKTDPNLGSQFEHLTWSPERVAEWISDLGFPQYKECFTENFISGPKLIHVNCSNLPQIGITDFEDMKVISYHTRVLLGIEEPLFSRSIRLPYRDNIGLFLERKGYSGVKSDSLTLSAFVEASGLQECSPEIKAVDKNKHSVPENSREENEAIKHLNK